MADQKTETVNQARYCKVDELCNKDDTFNFSQNVNINTLPSCRKSLKQHILRTNYQVGIWKRLHVPNPDIPVASNGHGWTNASGKLEPLLLEGELLPWELSDIAEGALPSSDNEDNEADDISDDSIGNVSIDVNEYVSE